MLLRRNYHQMIRHLNEVPEVDKPPQPRNLRHLNDDLAEQRRGLVNLCPQEALKGWRHRWMVKLTPPHPRRRLRLNVDLPDQERQRPKKRVPHRQREVQEEQQQRRMNQWEHDVVLEVEPRSVIRFGNTFKEIKNQNVALVNYYVVWISIKEYSRYYLSTCHATSYESMVDNTPPADWLLYPLLEVMHPSFSACTWDPNYPNTKRRKQV